METICYFIRNFNQKNIVSFWKIIVVHIVHSSRVACFKLKNYLYILFTTIFFIWPCDKIFAVEYHAPEIFIDLQQQEIKKNRDYHRDEYYRMCDLAQEAFFVELDDIEDQDDVKNIFLITMQVLTAAPPTEGIYLVITNLMVLYNFDLINTYFDVKYYFMCAENHANMWNFYDSLLQL